MASTSARAALVAAVALAAVACVLLAASESSDELKERYAWDPQPAKPLTGAALATEKVFHVSDSTVDHADATVKPVIAKLNKEAHAWKVQSRHLDRLQRKIHAVEAQRYSFGKHHPHAAASRLAALTKGAKDLSTKAQTMRFADIVEDHELMDKVAKAQRDLDQATKQERARGAANSKLGQRAFAKANKVARRMHHTFNVKRQRLDTLISRARNEAKRVADSYGLSESAANVLMTAAKTQKELHLVVHDAEQEKDQFRAVHHGATDLAVCGPHDSHGPCNNFAKVVTKSRSEFQLAHSAVAKASGLLKPIMAELRTHEAKERKMRKQAEHLRRSLAALRDSPNGVYSDSEMKAKIDAIEKQAATLSVDARTAHHAGILLEHKQFDTVRKANRVIRRAMRRLHRHEARVENLPSHVYDKVHKVEFSLRNKLRRSREEFHGLVAQTRRLANQHPFDALNSSVTALLNAAAKTKRVRTRHPWVLP